MSNVNLHRSMALKVTSQSGDSEFLFCICSEISINFCYIWFIVIFVVCGLNYWWCCSMWLYLSLWLVDFIVCNILGVFVFVKYLFVFFCRCYADIWCAVLCVSQWALAQVACDKVVGSRLNTRRHRVCVYIRTYTYTYIPTHCIHTYIHYSLMYVCICIYWNVIIFTERLFIYYAHFVSLAQFEVHSDEAKIWHFHNIVYGES